MQKAIQNLSTMLAILALVCISLVTFTACSDDDEPVAEVTYSWEFEEVSPSTPDFMDDKNKIEATFKTALGAYGSATSVTKQGTSETCDQEVLEVCQQAFNVLKGEAWQGRYTFTVTNVTTGTMIFIHTFNADNENRGIYTTSDLKTGDYYYSDGTWSDGGLREIKGDGTMVWAETTPQPKSGKTVIGIVFYAGHHPEDKSDYSKSGIRQAQCHGYVVALTNVNNNHNDRLGWEEQKVKYVMEGYEDFFAGAKNDITEMKYDGQGRLIEWVDNGKYAGHYTYEKDKILKMKTVEKSDEFGGEQRP